MKTEGEETAHTEEQEEAEHEGLEQLVDELRARRQDHVAILNQARGSTGNNTGTTWEEDVEIILQRFTVPTRDDIEELSRKISELDRKISALKQMRSSEKSRPYTN